MFPRLYKTTAYNVCEENISNDGYLLVYKIFPKCGPTTYIL